MKHHRKWRGMVCLCSSLALVSAAAPAQTQKAPTRAAAAPREASLLEQQLTGAARDEYDSARQLYDVGDASGALIKFGHAYELSKDPRLLWNMAGCELKLQHYTRVLRLIHRYEQEGGASFSDAERAEVGELTASLQRLVSDVRLVVNEPGASVAVDGELVGKTPLPEALRLDLGTHEILVSKPGFRDQRLERTVTGASQADLVLTLTPEQKPASVTIVSAPGSSIEVDHAFVGRGRWASILPSGAHVLVVTAPGMKTYRGTFELRTGERRSLDIALQPQRTGIPAVFWIAGSAVALAGLGTAGYFIFRSEPAPSHSYVGTIGAGQVQLP